jgi:hypothetical protein
VRADRAAYERGLIGVLEIASELFEGWMWACAVDEPLAPRILEARPLPDEARRAVERWAVELLTDTAAGALVALEQAVSAREISIRAFLGADPGGRTVAVMGFGPSASVSPEAEVILDAVTSDIGVFHEAPGLRARIRDTYGA